MKVSETGIRLMNQNCPFLDGKVLPKSVLSMKKFHACALEYGRNMCKFIVGIQVCTIFER